jgi:pimeloyl-[acyl-carrier protein] methyl ester esterase
MAPALTDLGAGRPLVLLHGWAVDRSFFSAQEPLAASHRIIAPDLAGHGDRPAGDAPPSMAALADDLHDMLGRLKLDGVVLVGWSMGATLALEFLSRGPAPGITGLVIVDMSPRVANDAEWRHGLAGGQTLEDARAAADRMEAHWADQAGRIARSMFAEGADEASPLVERATARIAGRDPRLMAAYWRSLVEADHRRTIAGLRVPVLALSGGRSRLYRSSVADWIGATAPRGEARVIPEAGHAPHLEQPQAFNEALTAFAAAL